ncbi:IS110 family transposase [Calidithermus timidus]|jgi:transposase|uniref:IS110 family transposase n=1 Tax=Calidithermus timidus TaxID=307124 RepID=UPI0003825030|nr:IS110 family transposase [Calidithermus timidus]
MNVGVDISRSRLDVAVGDDLSQWPNTPEGIAALIARLPSSSSVVMEATGVYYRPLAYALHRAGFAVYVVNPLQVRSYARSLLTRNKTDKADARLLARFLAQYRADLTPYEPLPEALYLASLLVRFAEGLTTQRTASLNRLHAWAYAHPRVHGLAQAVPQVLQDYRESLYSEARAVVEAYPVGASWLTSLQTLPGVGPTLALKLLAYSGDFRRFRSARAYAAYTGLTPRVYQSGELDTVARISRIGPPALRSSYYLAAVSATRTDTAQAAFYRRLVGSGKPKKLAIVAVAHRLARAAWAVCVR